MTLLESILTELLNAVQITLSDKVQKILAYDPDQSPACGVVTIVNDNLSPATIPTENDYFVDCTFHAMTLLDEDQDQTIIESLKGDLLRTVQNLTTDFLNEKISFSGGGKVVGILPGEGKSTFNEDQHLFSLGLRLVLIDVNF